MRLPHPNFGKNLSPSFVAPSDGAPPSNGAGSSDGGSPAFAPASNDSAPASSTGSAPCASPLVFWASSNLLLAFDPYVFPRKIGTEQCRHRENEEHQ